MRIFPPSFLLESPSQNPVKAITHAPQQSAAGVSETGYSGLALRPVVETINSDVRVPTLPLW